MDDKNFDQATANEWMKIIEDPSSNAREKDIYPILRTWLSHSSASEVLDVGCGQGVCSVQLGENQVQYIGLDPSPELIHRANKLYSEPSRTFLHGNSYHLPFKDCHFGAVFSVAVWHLLSDISKASNELSRVLKDEGSFLIVTADPTQYQAWMQEYEDKELMGLKFIGTNKKTDGSSSSDTLYLYPLDEIIETLEGHRLKISAIETVRSFIVIRGLKA